MKQFAKWVVNHTAAIMLACTVLVGLFYEVAAETVRDFLSREIESRGGGVCAVVPQTGHEVIGAAPGGVGYVTWRGVRRLRGNCGRPVVDGMIANGGGYYHDAPLSIRGLPLSVGEHTLSYRFKINEDVEPGAARFRVIVTYPEAVGGAPPAYSPWVNFIVSEREKDQPR
jgi:hypothetical protein